MSATETTAGIIRLATTAETQAGSINDAAVHPAGLAATALTDADKATTAEVLAGTDDSKYVTPATGGAYVGENAADGWPDVGTATIYDSTVTYTVPAGVHLIQVELLGGGGGGGGAGDSSSTGSSGGTTSFGSIFSASGGAGGTGGNASANGEGGQLGGFDVFAIINGRNGFRGENGADGGGGGYASPMGNLRTGSPGAGYSSSTGYNATGYANGGGGGYYSTWGSRGGGGGGGGFALRDIRVNPGETYTITVGGAGSGGYGSSYYGGNGAPGRARVTILG